MPQEAINQITEALLTKQPAEKAAAVGSYVQGLDQDTQRAIARAVAAVVPPPSGRTASAIWIIVVVAFAAALLATAITLCVGLFMPVADVTKQVTRSETILTVFTTVTGFLAGLLAPSPISNKGS